MSQEGVEHLCGALDDKINYFRQEYDLTYAEVIGVLEIIKAILLQEAIEEEDSNGKETG